MPSYQLRRPGRQRRRSCGLWVRQKAGPDSNCVGGGHRAQAPFALAIGPSLYVSPTHNDPVFCAAGAGGRRRSRARGATGHAAVPLGSACSAAGRPAEPSPPLAWFAVGCAAAAGRPVA